MSNERFSLNNVDPEEMRRRALVVGIGMMAITGCSLVVLFMRSNSSLNHHPNKLIYYMCLSEAISCYSCMIDQVNAKDFIEHFNLDRLFSWTLFGWCTEEEAL